MTATEITYMVAAHIGGRTVPTAVCGEPVAPGLAIGPALEEGVPIPDLYVLTHIRSGKVLGTTFCRPCARLAGRKAVETGVDWTADEAAVVTDERARVLHVELFWMCARDRSGYCHTTALLDVA